MFAEVQNVVASVDLRCKIKLERAASRLPGDVQVSYIPEQFPGVVVKIKKPKVSILVFSSGKLVVTGAKSVEMIEEAVEVISELLRQAGHNVKHEATITVQNIVASGTLGKRINLELAALLLEHSMYEPEQFPGLIYRMQEPKVVLLLFQSGKLVCTGAKKEEFVYQSIHKIYGILEEIDAFEAASLQLQS
ncbi:MAG: TATA-box-binding protein [Candidatus Hodarchaeales archaeon]